jgi:hypothetical protein
MTRSTSPLRIARSIVIASCALLLGCAGGGGDSAAPAPSAAPASPAALSTVIYGLQTASIPTRYDLYLVKADHTGTTRLTTSGDALNALAIEDARVIYTRWMGSHRHLYAVGTDGSSNVSLGSDTAAVDQLLLGVLDHRAIFQVLNAAEGANACDLFSVKLDGSDLRQIGSYAYANGVQAITPLVLGGKVVYTDISGGAGDLYAVNADGSGLRALSATSTLDTIQGELNPLDASTGKLVYEVFSGSNVQFHAVKLDGTGETTLAPGFQKQAAVKVASGQLFYLLNTTASYYDLWAVNLDGTHNRRLATANGSRSLALGDISSTQAFYTAIAGSIREVYAVNLDGTGTTALSPLGQNYGFAGLAGGKVVMSAFLGTGLNRLYVVSPDGTGLTPLTPGTELAYYLGSWNNRIYYSRNLGASGSVQYAIFSCALDGSGVTTVVSNGAYSAQQLTPANARFVYQRSDTSVSSDLGVGSVQADGTGELLLTPGTATLLFAQ